MWRAIDHWRHFFVVCATIIYPGDSLQLRSVAALPSAALNHPKSLGVAGFLSAPATREANNPTQAIVQTPDR